MLVVLKGSSRILLPSLSMLMFVVVLLILAPPTAVDAALDEVEPPAQYEDWDTAYDLTPIELGTPFDVRKEGGGDWDFIRMDFLSLGDLVVIELDNYGDPWSTVEYWVFDPARFPVAYASYEGTPPSNTTMRFSVGTAGPYHFVFGSGFGDTVIRMNVTVVSGSSQGDSNDRPNDAVDVNGMEVVDGTLGQPDDPSDFFRILVDSSPELKTFLSFSLSWSGWTEVKWELYNSSGILRPSLQYTSDGIAFGDSTDTFDERLLEPEILYLRLWCVEGSGDYKLYVHIETYPEDGDDWMEGAGELVDGQTVNGTLHTRFDKTDYLRIDVDVSDTIQLTMDVDDDADLFLLSEDGHRVASSDNWDDESEYISYKVPQGGNDTYYVLIALSTELDLLPYREINYTLHVVTNLPPEVHPDYAKTYASWPMLEDRVDEGILLTDLFIDPEGRPLTFRVVPGHNESFLMATVTGAMRLRLVPAENVSGFVEAVTVEAVDVGGKAVRFTVSVAVMPVNDAPVVGHPTADPPPAVLEVPEDGTGGPWDVLFWFWDSDDAISELVFEFDSGPEVEARTDDLDRMYMDAVEDDWNGWTNLTIRVRDPEGLGALLRLPVHVTPVNDPPVLVGPDITMVHSGRPTANIDVGGSFEDVDGDRLGYVATSEQEVNVTVNGSRVTVGRLLHFQALTVVFEVKAMDTEGETSDTLTVTIEVGDIPDPHHIVQVKKEYTVLRGGKGVFLDFDLEDPDGLGDEYTVEFSYSGVTDVYTWKKWREPREWSPRRPIWEPDPVGVDEDVMVTMAVMDEWYVDRVSWTVHVRSHNSAPVVQAIRPDSRGPYDQAELINLTVEAYDADGDDLTYCWTYHRAMEGEVNVESGPSLVLFYDSSGRHQVTVVVSDGFENTTAYYNLTVSDDPGVLEEGGVVLVLAVVLISAVAVVAYFVLRKEG